MYNNVYYNVYIYIYSLTYSVLTDRKTLQKDRATSNWLTNAVDSAHPLDSAQNPPAPKSKSQHYPFDEDPRRS